MEKVLGAGILLLGAATAQAEVTPNDPLPIRILNCGGSVITEIGARLEGDANFSSGTSVFYRNGGGQVSYDKISAIINSTREATTFSFALCLSLSTARRGIIVGKSTQQQICAPLNRGPFRTPNTVAAALKPLPGIEKLISLRAKAASPGTAEGVT